jgi:predicted dehydrogenase
MGYIAGDRPVKLAAFGGQDHFVYGQDVSGLCSTCPRGRQCHAFSESDAFCPFSEGFDWPDNAMAVIEYANGLRATYNFDMFSVRYHRSISAYGEKGQALGKDEDPPYLELYDANGRQSFHDFGRPKVSGHGFGGDTRLIRHFFDCIESRKPSPFTTQAVVDSVAVPLAMEESWKTGKVVNLQAY